MRTRQTANIKTSRSIMPRWVKNWEDSAGKPYEKPTRNPTSWTKIGQTVREAQDILARLAFHQYADEIRCQKRQLTDDGCRIAFLTGARDDYVWPGLPKSLGELCIELAQERLTRPFRNITPDGLGVVEGIYYFPHVKRDIQYLRRIMWHRND